ncbi:hypothetical protein DRQ00_08190, partial [candidate division KSB1 bacterium]
MEPMEGHSSQDKVPLLIAQKPPLDPPSVRLICPLTAFFHEGKIYWQKVFQLTIEGFEINLLLALKINPPLSPSP